MLLKHSIVSDKEVENTWGFILKYCISLCSVTIIDVMNVHVIHRLMPILKAFWHIIFFYEEGLLRVAFDLIKKFLL